MIPARLKDQVNRFIEVRRGPTEVEDIEDALLLTEPRSTDGDQESQMEEVSLIMGLAYAYMSHFYLCSFLYANPDEVLSWLEELKQEVEKERESGEIPAIVLLDFAEDPEELFENLGDMED